MDIVCQHPIPPVDSIHTLTFTSNSILVPSGPFVTLFPKPRQHTYKSSVPLESTIVLQNSKHIIACTHYRHGH